MVGVLLPPCCRQFVGGRDGGPAERAVGGGLEPRVDAVDVERVAAGRQLAEPLAVAEVGEAHGAVALALALAVVPEGGYPANGRRLEATAWCFFLHDNVHVVVVVLGDVVGAPEEEEAAAGEEEVVGEQEQGNGEDPHDGH